MSENQPKPPDRTPLYIAIVGGLATIGAALIGVLPNMLNRNAPTPTPLVITATPVPTQVSIQTNVPTNTVPATVSIPTAGPPTETRAPLTITLEATLPAATVAIPVTATSPPPPTVSNVITLILINNLPQTMEFFVDGASVTTINSGEYQPLQVPRGTHEMKQCISGTDTCFAKETNLQANPDVWEMFSTDNSLLTQANVSLLVLNRVSTPRDIYIDGQLAHTVEGVAFTVILVPPGTHTIQPCFPGNRPPNGVCRPSSVDRYTAPTEYYVIDVESS